MTKLWGLALALSCLVSVPAMAADASSADAVRLNNEGVDALKGKETEKAISKFKLALQKDSSYKLARENLAIAYNNFGIAKSKNDPKGAMDAFHLAFWLSPDNQTCKQNLDESVKAAGKKPDSFEDRVALAEEALKRNEFAGGIVEYQHALALKADAGVKAKLAAIKIPDEYKLSSKPAVEADADVDFGPYMADMQRRVKRAWFPPRGKESVRVQVIWKIHSDGKVSDIKLSQPSGERTADEAAMKAVENASPMRPLPVGAPEVVDIQFTFDYNVFGGDPEKGLKSRLARAEKSNDTAEILSISLEYGKFCEDKNRKEDAKKIYDKGLAAGKTYTEKNEKASHGPRTADSTTRLIEDLEARINTALGDLYYAEDKYKEANDHYLTSYELYVNNQLIVPRGRMAHACRDLGYSYVYMEDGLEDKVGRARKYFNRALELLTDDPDHKALLVDVKYGLAHCEWKDNNYAKALPLYKWVLDESEKLSGNDRPDFAVFMQRTKDVADCHYQLGQLAEALPLYRSALNYADQARSNDLPLEESELDEAHSRVDELCAKLNVPTDAQIAQEKEAKKTVNKAYAWLPYALGGSLLALLIMYLFGQKQNSAVDLKGKSDKKSNL